MIARGKRLANNKRAVNVDCCYLRAGALSTPDPDLPELAEGGGSWKSPSGSGLWSGSSAPLGVGAAPEVLKRGSF